MTRIPVKELKALVASHPVPQEDKLQRRIDKLERMALFYESKIPEAPVRQSLMFSGFISALLYAIATIKMYRKLTKRLAEMAGEGATDEDNNNT